MELIKWKEVVVVLKILLRNNLKKRLHFLEQDSQNIKNDSKKKKFLERNFCMSDHNEIYLKTDKVQH